MVGRIIFGWFVIACFTCWLFGNYLKKNFPEKEAENKYLAELPVLNRLVLWLLAFPLLLVLWIFAGKDGGKDGN